MTNIYTSFPNGDQMWLSTINLNCDVCNSDWTIYDLVILYQVNGYG